MGRQARVFDPDWIYHVVAKGNNGEAIVHDDIDRRTFVCRFDRVAVDFRIGDLRLVHHAQPRALVDTGA
jgi:hypothetical protein